MVERRPLTATTDKPTASSTNGGAPPTFAAVQGEIAAAMAAGELTLAEKFALFEKKLKAALTDSSTTASELAKLLHETDNAVAAAQQQATVAREAAYDPATDLSQARAAMEDAQFFVGRLQSQVPRLQQRYRDTALKEQVQTYCAKLADFAPERDALAAELRATYEAATSKLLDVFERARTFEARARSALGNPPSGVDVLERLDTRVLDKCVLPDWQHPDRNLWPPASTFAVDFVMPVPQHPGAAWSDPVFQERRRAEIVAEQERLALHAQARAKEQLALENQTLRENWEASQRRG